MFNLTYIFMSKQQRKYEKVNSCLETWARAKFLKFNEIVNVVGWKLLLAGAWLCVERSGLEDLLFELFYESG